MPEPDDIDRRRKERWQRYRALTPAQRLDLASALLRREPLTRRDESFKFVRHRYPTASDSLVHSIVHHYYWTLPSDCCDLLAYMELCFQEQDHHSHNGLIHSVLYNLYNLLQAERLVPFGSQGVFDTLNEVKECLELDDRDGALATLKSLIDSFESNESPPDFD